MLSSATKTRTALYRVIWRWHFFAGLLVLPFLVLMAVTGGAYLFKPELDHWMYRRLEDVPARSQPFAPLSLVVQRVESDLDGRVIEITPALAATQAVRLQVRVSGGEVRTVYADPYDAHVTGSTGYGGIMQTVRKIHSLQKFGFWASCLIEITAGWTMLLVGTGLYMWWPRGKAAGVMTVRGSPRGRLFWRDLHALGGALTAAVILFLAVTGMPWSMFWGDHFQRWATAAQLNEPAPPAAVIPEWLMSATMPDMPHSPHIPDARVPENTPWSLERATLPESHPAPGNSPLKLDAAMLRFQQLNVEPGASIALPEGAQGAYVATWRPDRAEEARIVYLDQYSGAVLGDVGFRQWGPIGKTIEWSIAVHQGQEYGVANRYLMLGGCVGIVLLAASAITMWWKRRPAGSLGLPPAPEQPDAARAFLVMTAVVGMLFPLLGVSILVALTVRSILLLLRAASSQPIRRTG